LHEKAVNLTDSLFGQFIRLRISKEWDKIKTQYGQNLVCLSFTLQRRIV